jgi:outer membrane PBP1 activator LpoA protein
MSDPIVPLRAPRRQALLVIGLALVLGACATAPSPPSPSIEARIEAVAALAVAGRHAEAAAGYGALALAAPARAAGLLARAAEEHAIAGDRAAAMVALERARALPQQPADVGELALARAAVARLDGDLQAMLQAVAFDVRDLPDALAARVLLTRADAEARLGSPFLALDDLVARDGLLDGDEARRANAELTWNLLTNLRGSLDPAQLALNSPAGSRAWLELAGHARRAWQDPAAARAGVESWRDAHGGHPAAEAIVPRLLEQIASSTRYPAKVALLLPLTGRFAAQAEAVRDGFMAAHYASGAQAEVALFDTTDYPGGASRAHEEARAWGAGFMVGPLTREGITEIAIADATPTATTGANADSVSTPPATPVPRIPLLALNYLDGGAATPDRLWQFGLLPEGEAEAVAEHAVALGLTRAVALYPKGDWGARMMAAFQRRFEALGGVLLSAQLYDPAVAEKDFSTSIMRMLNIDESRSRAGLVANLLGSKLETEPRRRRDAEFVFVAARDREAPLLRAQLRFHRASELPTFATSAVYRTDGAPEPDLDGIEFADMPWAIDAADPTRVALAALWPDGVARQARLYALGLDAYRLVPQLANLPSPLAEPVPGATGLLSMQDGHRIRRDLFWARFDDGVPKPVTTAAASALAPTNVTDQEPPPADAPTPPPAADTPPPPRTHPR